MIRVENKRIYHGKGIYIGRPGLLGNPFEIGAHGNREEVILSINADYAAVNYLLPCQLPASFRRVVLILS